MSLSEAVDAGILGGLRLAGARTARHRYKATFPKPVGYDGTTALYNPEALAAWAARRGKD